MCACDMYAATLQVSSESFTYRTFLKWH